MKSFVKLIGLVGLMATMFMSCVSLKIEEVDWESLEPGEYAGKYNESLTPENSCIICFTMPMATYAEFKQINPKLDPDVQVFKYPLKDTQSVTIFKPCKPGSRYMLTKFNGIENGGISETDWFIELKPSEQYFVIDVPNEPGIYHYGMFLGRDVLMNITKKKTVEINKPNSFEDNGLAFRYFAKDFGRFYGQTPWVNAYIETINKFEEAKE